MKMLKKTLTGLLMFGILMGFIVLTGLWDGKGQPFFDALLLIITALCSYEMITHGKKHDYNVTIIPIAIEIVAIYPMIWFFGYVGMWASLGAGMLLTFIFFVFDKRIGLKGLLYSLLVTVYAVLPFALALCLTHYYGMLPLLLAAASAMLSDTVAYYAGSAIKGPKIFPTISPKKTYSGSIIGLLGGAGGALVVYALFEYANVPVNDALRFTDILSNPILFYALTGTAIAVLSEIGDLFASKIKREFGIKDFSNLLGSHGGVIDRLDSIIFSIYFIAILMAFLMPV